MTMKCIAIGNRIMGDDSIGIKVVEEILVQLKQENIEVIFGETDVDYALRQIGDGDILIIIDATYFNITPGTVTLTPIKEDAIQWHQFFSQHQPSLINLITVYGKRIEGFIIGIEVKEVDFSLELSDTLKTKFSHICEEVYGLIQHVKKGGESCTILTY